MPMYDYRCETCGRELEQLDRIDAPAPSCPACSSAMVRLVSPVVVRAQGVRPEVAPVQQGAGARPDSKPKRSGREVIDRVAARMVRESNKPGATPITHEQAVVKATRIRLRKERDGRG